MCNRSYYSEADPDVSIKWGGFGKKSNFKAIRFKKNQTKDTEAWFKAIITKYGKKKNDKDEIINILLKHVFYQSTTWLKKEKKIYLYYGYRNLSVHCVFTLCVL